VRYREPLIYIAAIALFSLSIEAGLIAAQQPTRGSSDAAVYTVFAARQGSDEVPLSDIPQSFPCGNQARSFKDLMASFDGGRVPSANEVSGTWVLVGLWLYKDSKPDLNCNGLNRGRKLEWVIVAKGYSIEFDSIGDPPQVTSLKPDHKGNLTFSIGFGGENSPVFRCRLTVGSSLVCSGSTYYQGAEFKKIPINEDQIYRPKPAL
jgi:hypothetical protein